MQVLINNVRYNPKSRLIVTLSLMLTFFLLLVIHSSAADDFEYVCIVDAGSTGSRIHVYKYRPPEKGQQLISVDVQSEKYKKFYPGLSSFEEKPDDLQAMETYFEPILNFGRDHVPADKRHSTALFVLASAGMRKVRERNEKTAQRVMDTAFKHLSESSGFVVVRDGIKIIEGRNEGLWGWMAANYLNGELGRLLELSSKEVYSKQTTKGIVEMGGESLQITFIPREPALRLLRSDGVQEHVEKVQIGNVQFELFTNSWMGIGMEAAQNAFDSHLVTKGLRTESPCYNRGVSRERQHGIGQAVTWSGSGDFSECYRGLSEMVKDRLKPKCAVRDEMKSELVCTPNSVVMPAIDIGLATETQSAAKQEFYYIENFYYTAEVLEMLDVHGLPFLETLRSKGQQFCAMERADAVKAFPKAEEDEIDKTCFCAAWLLAILQEGFSLGQFANFKVIRDIEGKGNIDWALGYLVAEVPAINRRRTGPLESEMEGEGSSAFRWLLVVMSAVLMAYCWKNSNKYGAWRAWLLSKRRQSPNVRVKGNGRYAYQRLHGISRV